MTKELIEKLRLIAEEAKANGVLLDTVEFNWVQFVGGISLLGLVNCRMRSELLQ